MSKYFTVSRVGKIGKKGGLCLPAVGIKSSRPPQEYPQDDGGAEKGREDIDGKDAGAPEDGRKDAQQPACQHDDAAEKDDGGDEDAMGVGGAKGTGEVRHGEADEGDGAAERGDEGAEETDGEQEAGAMAAHVVAHGGDIRLAEEEGVERITEDGEQ